MNEETLSQKETEELLRQVSQDVTFDNETDQFETELFDNEMYYNDTEEVA